MAGSGTAHLRPGPMLLRVEDLHVELGGGRRKKPVQAVSGLSFDIAEGETLGLVGESGCGKTTTGRAILRLQKVTSGRVLFESEDLSSVSAGKLRRLRRHIQVVFQDPRSSFNPRRSVDQSLEEPLKIWGMGSGQERRSAVASVLSSVGVSDSMRLDRRPNEFSGGQAQRLSIARTLLMDPQIIVCDEVVSALDVSIQAQILNLLMDLKKERGLSLLFISHDLAVVKNISDRIAVMYMGKLCEIAPSDSLYERPLHPYTRILFDAVPVPDPSLKPVPHEEPSLAESVSPTDPPSGCRFRLRCPIAQERCAKEEPQVREMGENHFVACHYAG